MVKIEYGDYEWKSYKDCYEESECVAKYLISNAICPREDFGNDGQLRFVALFSKNREEWVITDLGA